MQALEAAQNEYDGRQPSPVSESPQEDAECAWVMEGIKQLMQGADYLFQRRMRPRQGVTQEQFAEAVDEFAMEQLTGNCMSKSALGRLVLCAHSKSGSDAQTAAHAVLAIADPDAKLREIARGLLDPLAADGVLAEAESL